MPSPARATHFPQFHRSRAGSSTVEQHPFKLLVPGSNPGQPTTGEHFLLESRRDAGTR